MFPTEAYLIAALVGVVCSTFASCWWSTLDALDKLVVPMMIVCAMLGTFIVVSEVWWMVLIYRSGVMS